MIALLIDIGTSQWSRDRNGPSIPLSSIGWPAETTFWRLPYFLKVLDISESLDGGATVRIIPLVPRGTGRVLLSIRQGGRRSRRA